MDELKKLRTEMLLDMKYLGGEIAKAWSQKNMKNVHFYKGKQNVVRHYLKQVDRALARLNK